MIFNPAGYMYTPGYQNMDAKGTLERPKPISNHNKVA
jgi:hypothetical protein